MTVGALLLTPGAGGGRDHATLVAVEQEVAPLPVARVDFPYRREGRKAPDRAPKLIACVVEEAAALAASARRGPRGRGARGTVHGRAHVLHGRGRGVARGRPGAAELPLHPPGKPEKLRTEHLPAVRVPCLFVAGTRDPFGTPEEVEAATAVMPGPVTHVWLDGARHDPKGLDAEIARAVADWVATLGERRGPGRSGRSGVRWVTVP